ncbi:MAG: hypothetical protein AB9842_12210 [Bacteroidales bacterium]
MKKYILTGIIFLSTVLVNAQRPFELGFIAGPSLYHGDIARFYQCTPGLAGGAFTRYSLHWPIAFRANVIYGFTGANDKIHPERKLNFRSTIFEYSFQLEFFITRPKSGFKNYSVKYGRRKYYVYNFPMTSYAFIGIGRFHFNPKGKTTDGSWHSLQPLSTEGQGVFPTRDEPYPLSSTIIPVGIGAKFPWKDAYMIGFELGLRKTLTDYFDDVSLTYVNTQVLEEAKGNLAAYFADPSYNSDLTTKSPAVARGNPKNKDAYIFAFVTLQYDFSKVKKKKSFRI